MSDHHDGIEEHDNHLPNWWLITLFGSIVFAFFYWTYYQTLAAGPAQAAELKADEAALAALRERSLPPISDDILFAMSKDPTVVARGDVLFKANCVACHGARAEGTVGPNLTDDFWIHGSQPMKIHGVITRGVTEKGMLAWGNILGDAKVRDVAAYVLSLKNTNVAGGKAPQGEKAP